LPARPSAGVGCRQEQEQDALRRARPSAAVNSATPPASGGAPGMIAHDSQTEGYYIISGGGTLITGGKIINGSKTGPTSEVTTTLNGPSCNGTAYGDETFQRKVVQCRRHHHHSGRRPARLDGESAITSII
jgi:hypothetical protein